MGNDIWIEKYNFTIISWLFLLTFSVNRKSNDLQLVSQGQQVKHKNTGCRLQHILTVGTQDVDFNIY
jgi:hypothetical protein